MRYLRPVRAVVPPTEAGADCLDAFARELDYLYATLQRLGARRGDIQDLLQDVFTILHDSWPTLDTSRPIRPWLFAVAFRVVRTSRRRQAREMPCEGLEPEDAAPSPEGWLQGQESLGLLYAALDRVPATRRSVLVMHEIDGLEVIEIARRLSITKFGVYARLHKGRKELAAAVRHLRRQEVRR